MIDVLNTMILIGILFLIVIIFIMDGKLRLAVEDIKLEDNVMDMKKKDFVLQDQPRVIYKHQLYKLEDYFVYDVYADMKDTDARTQRLERDYVNVFAECVRSILDNKEVYNQTPSKTFGTLKSLQYKFYTPVLLFAKFTVDYDYYLQKYNQNYFKSRVEAIFEHFDTDAKYFVTLDNGKRVHLMHFVQQAEDLYISQTDLVNECLYYKQCKIDQLITQVIEEEKKQDTEAQERIGGGLTTSQ